jgi:hypothetical protein
MLPPPFQDAFSMSESVATSEPAAVPVLLPVKGICKHSGLSKSTVYRWREAKMIEGVYIGRNYYVVVASVYAVIASPPRRH